MREANTALALLPKPLDPAHDIIRLNHCSIRTETQYVQWLMRLFPVWAGKAYSVKSPR